MSDRKKVVIEVSIKMITSVPNDWEANNIDFWLNDSSHCLENEFVQIYEEMEHNDKIRPNTCCVCQRATGKYIKDADENDYSEFAYINEKEESTVNCERTSRRLGNKLG